MDYLRDDAFGDRREVGAQGFVQLRELRPDDSSAKVRVTRAITVVRRCPEYRYGLMP